MNGDLFEPRQVARADGDEQIESAVGKHQAERTTERTGYERLDEQLSGNA